MSKYATTQAFGGQRLSLKRAVLIKIGDSANDFVCGDVRRIDGNDQASVVGSDGVEYTLAQETTETLVGFFEAKSEGDLDQMPMFRWCWPPRV